MADIQHSDIPHADCHEPKWLGIATSADAGKVITPSSTNGVSELRKLTFAEIATGTVKASFLTFVDDTDITKKAVFLVSGVTTATTRTYTLPDATGTVALIAATQTLTNKRINPRVVALTDAATIAVDSDITDQGNVTLAGNRTLGAPTGTPVDGQRLRIRVRQDATAGRTLAYNAIYRFTGAAAPTVTATAAETTYLDFVYHSTDVKWDCVGTTLDIRA